MNRDEALLFNYQNSDSALRPIHLLLNSADDFNRRQWITKWCYCGFGYSKKLLPAYWAKDFILKKTKKHLSIPFNHGRLFGPWD